MGWQQPLWLQFPWCFLLLTQCPHHGGFLPGPPRRPRLLARRPPLQLQPWPTQVLWLEFMVPQRALVVGTRTLELQQAAVSVEAQV